MSELIEETKGGKWWFATSTKWGSAYRKHTYATRKQAYAAQKQMEDDGMWVCARVRCARPTLTKYSVEVEHIRHTTIEVEATSPEEAEDKAYQIAKSAEYDGNNNWGCMEYNAEAADPVDGEDGEGEDEDAGE